MGLSAGKDGGGVRWGWGTNDCSRMASEEKQIFALDLRHIPGIQMTCPAAESPSSPNQPLSLKRKTPARGPAFGLICMEVSLLRGAMRGRRGAQVGSSM